ncbi:hypothetical protein RD792_005914 [Penstemon davidsonii]|uniref:Peptidyl-prolyl cis-trans isomerase n=1 Tax=Penstemon davidsonii TaxID=160366 RepID=A0ABR0DDY5_9LAMI|nr:hypothetical protein RD792_005914 [Penstemon davidsonii]
MSVMLVTSLGDIVVDLLTDRCPLTCKNFLKLCKINYYNGCLFHTIQKDFIAQTGDPTGTGSGGDSVYKFLYGDQARFFGDEIHLDVKHSKIGTLAMASAGENLNASQFYITLHDDHDFLDGKHTVFGAVAEGLDTLTRINEAYIDGKNRPYKNIRIKHTYLLYDPFEDPPQLSKLIPDASPEGKPKDEVDDDVRVEDDWVPMDEQLNSQELEEVLRAKDAHSRAVVLETIGDIPDAEIKPPDNVLFVCKLNPVTKDKDLQLIFSKSGNVTSAEVIRDHKTGDSLCYAFIEFEERVACEHAHSKMKNALIDDRRIHVDFSQSVAKLWSQYRRKSQGQGGGCFKCGSLTGDSAYKSSKYTLKYDCTQRGGDGNTRYGMVFEEDALGSPKHSKHRGGGHKAGQHDDKRNTKRRDYNDSKVGDDWQKRNDRDKEHKEYVQRRTSLHGGRERDHPEIHDRSDRRKTGGRVNWIRTEEGEHKRRYIYDVDYTNKRDNNEYEKKRDERNGSDTKKRSVNGDIHRDRDVRDDSDGFKRRRGDERHSNNSSYKSDVRYRYDDDRGRRH